MLNQIKVAGYKIVAAAMLSQGPATAPHALFVAMRSDDAAAQRRRTEHASTPVVIVADWGFPQDGQPKGFYHNSDYFYRQEPGQHTSKVLARAYEKFAKRLLDDAQYYLSTGCPLTGEPQKVKA